MYGWVDRWVDQLGIMQTEPGFVGVFVELVEVVTELGLNRPSYMGNK